MREMIRDLFEDEITDRRKWAADENNRLLFHDHIWANTGSTLQGDNWICLLETPSRHISRLVDTSQRHLFSGRVSSIHPPQNIQIDDCRLHAQGNPNSVAA